MFFLTSDFLCHHFLTLGRRCSRRHYTQELSSIFAPTAMCDDGWCSHTGHKPLDAPMHLPAGRLWVRHNFQLPACNSTPSSPTGWDTSIGKTPCLKIASQDHRSLLLFAVDFLPLETSISKVRISPKNSCIQVSKGGLKGPLHLSLCLSTPCHRTWFIYVHQGPRDRKEGSFRYEGKDPHPTFTSFQKNANQ